MVLTVMEYLGQRPNRRPVGVVTQHAYGVECMRGLRRDEIPCPGDLIRAAKSARLVFMDEMARAAGFRSLDAAMASRPEGQRLYHRQNRGNRFDWPPVMAFARDTGAVTAAQLTTFQNCYCGKSGLRSAFMIGRTDTRGGAVPWIAQGFIVEYFWRSVCGDTDDIPYAAGMASVLDALYPDAFDTLLVRDWADASRALPETQPAVVDGRILLLVVPKGHCLPADNIFLAPAEDDDDDW